MKIEKVRKIAGREEIDYQFLLSVLSEYAHPRDKISEWIKSGDLIRVKKGLYVFGEHIAQTPYSHKVLANLIYGPSAISLNYALSFYGLIPERVTTITSITHKRNKIFSTSVGEFTYKYISLSKYPIEIELVNHSKHSHFLIASPEKALCDHITLTDKKIKLASLDDINNYLLQDLRIDESALRSLRANKLINISKAYDDPRLELLTKFIRKWRS
jgi:predicted transcriptional regulator of viral defense system